MKNIALPRLCGGTFFVLLLQALKPRTKARATYVGGSDGLNETDVLINLIRVAQSNYPEPPSSTFPQNTSAYKSCTKSGGTYLPFEDSAFIMAFDNCVKSDYPTSLAAMSGFVDSFIDVSAMGKHINLVKALLELIDADETISDSDVFYIGHGIPPVAKRDIRGITDICLPSFLLGVWHFIVTYRSDNKVGKSTYDQWNKPSSEKGSKRIFCSDIGCSITRTLNVTVSLTQRIDADTPEVLDEPYSDCESEPQEDDAKADSRDAPHAINNNGIIIQQFGTDNKQIIGNIETLIINND